MTTNIINLPEYRIIESNLLRLSKKEMIEDVNNTLTSFVQRREEVLPFLSQDNISKFKSDSLSLHILFDQVAKLAAGRESNFINKEYRVFLLQLSYQLAFLSTNLFPDNTYGKTVMMKVNQISTSDLRIENKILDKLLKEVFPNILIPLVDTEQSDRVQFWDIEIISYFLGNLLELGDQFKEFQNRY